MAIHRKKMKKWQKTVKKRAKIGNFHRFLDNFSKFNNFANIFLTNKFDPGNERFKELLSYKIKTYGLGQLRSKNKPKHNFIWSQILGGGPSSDPHRKLQGVIGSQKNHILNALPGRIGSR